MVYFETGLQTV